MAIFHQNMTPSWLEAHASYIDRFRSSTTGQLTFNAGLSDNAALLKVPIIPADILEDSSLVTLKIVFAMDESIGEKEDSDPRYGVSDGVNFVGFVTVDKPSYDRGLAPCFGIEGTSGLSLTATREMGKSPTPEDSFYPDHFVITVKPSEHSSPCYTAHDGGFVKTATYDKRLLLSKGLTLEVYKHGKDERVGIKFIEVTVE